MKDQDFIDEGYKDGKKSFEHYAKQCGKTFNFDSVHKAMNILGWNWVLGKDRWGNPSKGIPSIETIKNYAYGLLKDVYDKGSGCVSSGGFKAGWHSDGMYLEFIIEDWND